MFVFTFPLAEAFYLSATALLITSRCLLVFGRYLFGLGGNKSCSSAIFARGRRVGCFALEGGFQVAGATVFGGFQVARSSARKWAAASTR
jgi:hypothetical protein